MKCPICCTEISTGEEYCRWGPEWAHARCVAAYNLGKDDARAAVEADRAQRAPEGLASAVFTVLEGFTLPHDVRKILEAAYYTASTPAQPAPQPVERKPMTRSQISKASGDAQIAFCLDKQPTYEVALVHEVERHHGIRE